LRKLAIPALLAMGLNMQAILHNLSAADYQTLSDQDVLTLTSVFHTTLGGEEDLHPPGRIVDATLTQCAEGDPLVGNIVMFRYDPENTLYSAWAVVKGDTIPLVVDQQSLEFYSQGVLPDDAGIVQLVFEALHEPTQVKIQRDFRAPVDTHRVFAEYLINNVQQYVPAWLSSEFADSAFVSVDPGTFPNGLEPGVYWWDSEEDPVAMDIVAVHQELEARHSEVPRSGIEDRNNRETRFDISRQSLNQRFWVRLTVEGLDGPRILNPRSLEGIVHINYTSSNQEGIGNKILNSDGGVYPIRFFPDTTIVPTNVNDTTTIEGGTANRWIGEMEIGRNPLEPFYMLAPDPSMLNMNLLAEIDTDSSKIFRYEFQFQSDPISEELIWQVANHPLGIGGGNPGGKYGVPLQKIILGQNYPNPCNPSTTIPFEVPNDATGDLHVYIFNVRGQLVRDICLGEASAGKHQVFFDGVDNRRSKLASGDYLFKAAADNYRSDTRKLDIRY